MKPGSLVFWSPIPNKAGILLRVVEDWSDSEPARYLLTEPEGTEMRCYVALTCDCSFDSAGEPPVRVKLSSSKPPTVTLNTAVAEDR